MSRVLSPLGDLRSQDIRIDMIFLEASDDPGAALQRFAPTTPGRYGLPIAEAIQTERLIVHPFREESNQLLDTSDINVHECKRLIQSAV